MVVAGNKCDLPNEAKLIPTAKGKQLAKDFNCPFYETSAKENINVSAIFEDAARQALTVKCPAPVKKKKFCIIS